MKKITLLLISVFLLNLIPLSAQERNAKTTQSIVASYYAPLGCIVDAHDWKYAGGIKVDYLFDYNLSNVPLFLGFGGEVGYLLNYDNQDNYQDTNQSVYLGIPVQFGGVIPFGNKMILKPFIRIAPLVAFNIDNEKYNGKTEKMTKVAFGGIAPQLGASLNISKLVLSLSYSFYWDSNGFYGAYWRCGEHGFNIGVGYSF